ncbi:hypothetical protein LINPERHAP2_LOCUS9030, partial [Linum perenne]
IFVDPVTDPTNRRRRCLAYPSPSTGLLIFAISRPGLPAPRGSTAATAGLRRCRLGGGGSVGGGGSNMLRFYTEDAPRLKISLTLSDVTCFDVCIESLLIRRRERGLVDWRRRGMRCRGREGGLGIWVIGGGDEGRRRR